MKNKMKNKLLIERFQKLAGINKLVQKIKSDNPYYFHQENKSLKENSDDYIIDQNAGYLIDQIADDMMYTEFDSKEDINKFIDSIIAGINKLKMEKIEQWEEANTEPDFMDPDFDPNLEESKFNKAPLQENISSHKEEAKRFLEKFINDNEDAFEFIPDMSKGYINAKDNSYNVDELASIFLDMGQDIPRGKYNQKYKGEGGTYVVVA